MARIASYRGVFAGRRRSSRAGERGSTIVEFALLLPVFSLMLFGMIQFGLAFYGWDTLHNSVQTGARLAAIDNPGTWTFSDDDPPDYCSNNGVNDPIISAEMQSAIDEVGSPDATTGNLYCEILAEIGTPPGSDISAASPAKVNITVVSLGGGGTTVEVCAQVQAQTFTGFFPSIGLSSSSQFYVDDPGVHTYQPYGAGACPGATLTIVSASPNPTLASGVSVTAQLSGTGPNSNGTMTFSVYGPSANPPTSCDPTTGGLWETLTPPTAVHGDGAYTSENFTPPTTGQYWWYASFSGSSALNSGCGSSMFPTPVTA